MSHPMRAYRAIRPIGGGGMGEVWEGRIEFALEMERPCAMKFIRDDRARDAMFLELFGREAMTAWDVTHSHPNLVTTYDWGVASDGRLCLIMELVQGPAIGDISEQLAGDTALLLRVAFDVLLALGHAHKHGVIHRDVSPSNILLDRRGKVMLADFGVVRCEGGPVTEGFGGVAAYAAPEWVLHRQVTNLNDLYSLGAVLYELVAGAPPYGRGKLHTIRKNMREIEPALPDGTPRDLAALIMGLIAWDPKQRMSLEDALRLLRTTDEPIADDEDITALLDDVLPDDEARAEDDEVLAKTPIALYGAAIRFLQETQQADPTAQDREPEPEPEGQSQRAEPRPAMNYGQWNLRIVAAAVLALVLGIAGTWRYTAIHSQEARKADDRIPSDRGSSAAVAEPTPLDRVSGLNHVVACTLDDSSPMPARASDPPTRVRRAHALRRRARTKPQAKRTNGVHEAPHVIRSRFEVYSADARDQTIKE